MKGPSAVLVAPVAGRLIGLRACPRKKRFPNMSRIAVLVGRPKATLMALATSMAAVGLAVGSGAEFTSASANPANTFSSGTLSHTNSKTNAAILTAAGMKPGDSASGSVTITNTGSLAGTFTLSKSNLTNPQLGTGSEKLSDQLDLVIEDGATVVYSGKLGAMGAVALDGDTGTSGIQPFGASGSATAAHTYTFTVTLPSATGNAYQGTSTSVQYDWNAS